MGARASLPSPRRTSHATPCTSFVVTPDDPRCVRRHEQNTRMVAKFYNLVTDFYECVRARVVCCLCRVFFVSCSAVALLHPFLFDPGTDGASVFICSCEYGVRYAARLSCRCTRLAASQFCCFCFPPSPLPPPPLPPPLPTSPPPPPPPPSPMSSHSSGIRRYDERIANAIEMNGSFYVTCDL